MEATCPCGAQISHCSGFSCAAWALGARASGVAALGRYSTGSTAVAHRLSSSAAYGIFLDQGLNPCLLHWQEDSLPLSHQGSPLVRHVNCKIPKFFICSLNIVILKYICKGVNFFITLYQKQVNQLSVNRGRIKQNHSWVL